MKNRILLIVVVLLAVVYLFVRSFNKETSFFLDNDNITIKNMTTNVTESLNIEEYLIGVLAGEMPASFEEEALKAQSVASRTYAYYKINHSNKEYDITTDKNTQVFLTKEEMQDKWQKEYDFYVNKIINAINDTKGKVLTFNDEVIPAYYFAMSNGYTENAKTVFGEDSFFLQSVISNEDTSHRNFKVVKVISKNEFCNALKIDCNNISISNITRNEANRVQSIIINNVLYKGIEVRKLLDLRSTDFEIEIDNAEIYITTLGYGHGVGMSQYGANAMAKKGSTYEEILKHYYTGIEIKSIDSIK